jgi:hypothetical protein
VPHSAWLEKSPKTLPAEQDRHAAEFDEDLRRTPRHGVGRDRRAEHLDVPPRARVRISGDDMDMIELECWIAHLGQPFRFLLLMITRLGLVVKAFLSRENGRLCDAGGSYWYQPALRFSAGPALGKNSCCPSIR